MSQGGQAKTLSGGIIPSQVATQYVTDAGTATPSANVLNVNGLGGATTAGFGNTITVTAGAVPTTYQANSGSATPAGNILNVVGTGSTTSIAAGNTLTTELTGLTNHAVLVGAGTPTITNLAVGTNGQVLLGATGADPAFATLTSSGGTITFTPGVHSLNLEASGGAGVSTLTGNSGGAISPTAGNINIVTANSTPTFVGSGSTLTLDFSKTNLGLGNSLAAVTTATLNISIGQTALSSLTGGDRNIAIGSSALSSVTGGTNNIAIGESAGKGIVGNNYNIAIGTSVMATNDSDSNTAIGAFALTQNSGGSNVAVGREALRVAGATSENTAVGAYALLNLNAGTGNTALGKGAGQVCVNGFNNVFLGTNSGIQVDANFNTCVGYNSYGQTAATGANNTYVGYHSGFTTTTGHDNIALGYLTYGITSGAFNTTIGSSAGSSYTTSESSNILLGNIGTIGESNVMRLGTTGTGSAQVSTTYIAGVADVVISNPEPVFVDSSTGQFGTAGPNQVLQEFDDFLSDSSADNSVFSKLNWVNSQFGSFFLTSGLAGHPGIAEVAFGRTFCSLSTSLNSGLQLPIVVGGGQISINWVINLLALSAGGNTYDTWIGLGNGLASLPPTEPSDGIYFRYTDSVNGGRWQIATASGSVYTKQDSGVAASTNWVNLGIVVNAAGTSVSYFIDGVPVSTAITTNIPSIALAIIYVMVSSVGLLPQSLVDLMYYKHILTTPR